MPSSRFFQKRLVPAFFGREGVVIFERVVDRVEGI
jgi:hypothetical protein